MSSLSPERQVCPECAQGKHQNCTVTVLNLTTEKWEACDCATHAHAPHWHNHGGNHE